jgi:excisionase family DNA binding protein
MATTLPFREQIFCSINQACQATGSSRSKIYEWIKAGRIRTIRIDDRTKVVVASLLELSDGPKSTAATRAGASPAA